MTDSPEQTSSKATANATETPPERPPRGYFSRIRILQWVPLLALIPALAGGLVWLDTKRVEYGRKLEQTEQLKRDTAELRSVKDQLKTMQRANEQINEQLKATIKEKEELQRERTELVFRADKL